jgi:hypothetical protein
LQLVLAVWLWRRSVTRRLSLHWCLATWAAAAFITVGKVGFIGFNLGYAPWGLAAISGHALFAAAIWPVVAWAILAPHWPAHRLAPVVLGLLVAGVVAYGRVHTWAHSAVESVLGFGLGAACSLWPLTRARALAQQPDRPATSPRAVPGWLVASMGVWLLVWATLGPPSRAQAWVTAVALKLSGRSQPFYPDRGYEARRLQQQQQQRAYQRELQAQAAAQAASGAASAGQAGASSAGR